MEYGPGAFDTRPTVFADAPILDPIWTVEDVDLEDIVLAYMSQAGQAERQRRAALRVQR
jgi:hypothetical protein